MIHIAPAKLYEKFQREIDWATANDYHVFFEGVRGAHDPPERIFTRNERKIRQFFLLVLDLYPIFAEALGISLQKEKIVYPRDASNADVTFVEFVKQLDKNGFRCNFLFWLFSLIPKEKLKKALEEDAPAGGLNALMDRAEKRSFGASVADFLMRKATPIIRDYRNEVAVAHIRARAQGRNIFIHYGEKHIEGLVHLLVGEGFVVKETTHIDLAECCLTPAEYKLHKACREWLRRRQS